MLQREREVNQAFQPKSVLSRENYAVLMNFCIRYIVPAVQAAGINPDDSLTIAVPAAGAIGEFEAATLLIAFPNSLVQISDQKPQRMHTAKQFWQYNVRPILERAKSQGGLFSQVNLDHVNFQPEDIMNMQANSANIVLLRNFGGIGIKPTDIENVIDKLSSVVKTGGVIIATALNPNDRIPIYQSLQNNPHLNEIVFQNQGPIPIRNVAKSRYMDPGTYVMSFRRI